MLAKVFAEKKARKVGTASSVGRNRVSSCTRKEREQRKLTSALGVGSVCVKKRREREVSGLAEVIEGERESVRAEERDEDV